MGSIGIEANLQRLVISTARTWTGLADTGRVARSHPADTVDVAIRVLSDPSTWGQHHELTTTTVRDLTGHEPRTLDDFLRENRDSFR